MHTVVGGSGGGGGGGGGGAEAGGGAGGNLISSDCRATSRPDSASGLYAQTNVKHLKATSEAKRFHIFEKEGCSFSPHGDHSLWGGATFHKLLTCDG